MSPPRRAALRQGPKRQAVASTTSPTPPLAVPASPVVTPSTEQAADSTPQAHSAIQHVLEIRTSVSFSIVHAYLVPQTAVYPVVGACKKCNGPVEKIQGKGNRPGWYKAGFCCKECSLVLV